MDDILIMQFLRKKGVITDRDMHEFHELSSANLGNEHVIDLSSYHQSILDEKADMAKNIVSRMYHVENGKKYVGERFDMHKAEEVHTKYESILPSHVTICDIYIAINSQYHDYYCLFKSWFSNNIEQKIIESAIIFWFKDDDYKEDKIQHYFGEE